MTHLNERRIGERRRSRRGGRRTNDSLSPTIRSEIDDYLREVETALANIRTALDMENVLRARDSAVELRAASEALRVVLVTRRSVRAQGSN